MNRAYIRFKKACDFVIALVAVTVLSPLLRCVAIAIKTEDGGKIIFAQRRTGVGGKKFNCYKFRSMKNTEVLFDKSKPVIKDNNPNLTKVGKIIRKFKIDELPQLFNVIKGDMCIIGPRPLLPVYDSDYADWEIVKFEVRPGITGLGQVYGNGYLSIKDRKYYDVYYTMHASMWMDIKIAFKTIAVIIFGEKRFLRRVTEMEYRRLKLQVYRHYTIQPETLQELRPTALYR